MTLIHTDSRGRVSLGKILQPDRDYQVTTGVHGQITLEPVTMITDYERAVLSRPDLVAALTEAREQMERGEGVVRERGRRPQQISIHHGD
jgi:hypothetical protein